MYTKFITLSIFLILVSLNVSASYFRPHWYGTHQRIEYANEEIIVSKEGLFVKFKGVILIDEEIYNESDWVTFIFSPVLNYPFDKVEYFESHLGLQTSDWGGDDAYTVNKKAKYTVTNNTNLSTRYEYNVSIKDLNGWNKIIFFSNFTLKNRIKKTFEAEYSLLYMSQIETLNKDMIFYFPNKYEVIHYPENCRWESGTKYQTFLISGENAKYPMDFIFRDREEEKAIEVRERSIERLWNYIFAVMSAMLGFSFAILYEHYFRRDKKILGDTKLKHYKNHDSIIINIPKKKK